MTDGLPILDQNENETLYKLQNDLFDTVILVCDGVEYCLRDWQAGRQPQTLEEAAQEDWFELEQFLAEHQYDK